IAQALALHSSRVSPADAGVPRFWKGTAVTRRLRSSALSRRTERVQNPQAPSNTTVRCCGRSVKVTNLIVPRPSGWTGTGATRMAVLRRIPLPRTPVNREAGRPNARSDASVVVEHAFGDPQRQLLFQFLEVPLSVLVCVVADPQHHRILVWNPRQTTEGQPVPPIVPGVPSFVAGEA